MSMLLRQYHQQEPSEPLPKPESNDEPAKNASRKEWADYAIAQGHQPGSLEELTKKQIQSLFE